MIAPLPDSYSGFVSDESNCSMQVDFPRVAVIFGTRPEAIKLGPVIRSLAAKSDSVKTLVVNTGQHRSLLSPFLQGLGMDIEFNLAVMTSGQNPNMVCSKVISEIDQIFTRHRPVLTVVQGDTTTALAASIASYNRGIPIAHVEAGLRSFDTQNPFPEEMNRSLVTRMSSYHFAATETGVQNLLNEGVSPDYVYLTGNPVVDALDSIQVSAKPAEPLLRLLAVTEGLKRIVLTTHRRESFDQALEQNLKQIRRFVELDQNTAVIFPVHPNPAVAESANLILADHPRIFLAEPMPYDQFISLLRCAWLIVSDSGGVQEEAPSLGKPLLVLRKTTERPEALECGIGRLVGDAEGSLLRMLLEASEVDSWVNRVKETKNPFGDGHSGERIAGLICKLVGVKEQNTVGVTN